MAAPVNTFALPFWEDFNVSLSLLKNVNNSNDVKQLAMKGDIIAALIKPQMIVDVFQVLSAVTKALHMHTSGRMVTRTLHSEVLYSLSPNKNISDCFKKFGLDSSDNNLLVVEIHKEGESKLTEICSHVHGENIPLENITDMTDQSVIKKVYGIKEDELEAGSLLEAVVGRMASKELI